jgi:hypothetical protein
VLFKACGISLGLLTALLALYALMFRADSEEELSWSRQVDVLVGLLFAMAFLLIRIPGPPGSARWWKYRTALGMALIWAATSGALLFIHESVARIRWAAPRTLTSNRVKMVQLALSEYARDCGSPPSEEQGLKGLWDNPGVPNWSGPYLEPKHLTDAWGTAIRYSNRNGRLRVWSCGPDGHSGTDDDIVSEQ